MAEVSRYTVSLPPQVEKDLEQVAETLQIAKSEAFRRALTLLKHASEADEVILKTGDRSTSVLLK